MELFIDLKQLEELDIDVNSYTLLWCINNDINYNEILKQINFPKYIDFLQTRGYIKITPEGIFKRQSLIDLFKGEKQ